MYESKSEQEARSAIAGRSELVVCLHGLGRTRHCWWVLRRRLERAGYRTAAWSYPLRWPIERLGRDCLDRLTSYGHAPGIDHMHVVTHSLGGIILRHALTLGTPPKLNRIVMLAPPNRGSAWARRLGPWLGWLAPALPQLADAPDSFVNRLGAIPGGPADDDGSAIQVGVIAAASDGKCPVPTTHLPGRAAGQPGEAVHVVVPGRHTFLMYRRDVAEAVGRILLA